MAGEREKYVIAEGQRTAQQFAQGKDVNERMAASKALYDSVMVMAKAVPDVTEMRRLWNLQMQAFSQAILGPLSIGDQNHSPLKIVGTTADAGHTGLVVAVGGANGRSEKFFVLGADGNAHEAVRTDKGIVAKEGGKTYKQEEVEQMARRTNQVKATNNTAEDLYQFH